MCLAAVALMCASIWLKVATPLDRTYWKISFVRGSHLRSAVSRKTGNETAPTCKGLEDLLGERVPPARGLLVKMGQNVVLNRTNWKISFVGGSHLRKRFGASQEVGRSTLWQTRQRTATTGS